jgi:uncharacterized protein (DUF849 family)
MRLSAKRRGGRSQVLIKAAINGPRTRREHPAIPITPAQQASEAAAAVAAGAGAVHVHVRGLDGQESLAPEDVASALEAIHAACPGTPVGVSTGAWIVPNLNDRLSLIRAWDVLPSFASVNVHEQGALEVIRLLLNRGVEVEAGIWHFEAASTLLDSGLADECLRMLLEPAEEPGDPGMNLARIEAALDRVSCPRLLHGLGASAWEFVKLAAERSYDTRTGFEDTLTLPDGSPAESNAALVAAARRIVAETASP